MEKAAVSTDKAPAAIGPYSQGVVSDDLLFVSGQLPVNQDGVIPESIEAQTKQVFNNIDAILHAQNMTLADVIKTTVFIADLNEFAAMNAVYATFFTQGVLPARSAFQVAGVPKGAKLEVEVIARR
ncbi:Rid family detoxifying hydrolase [Bifidobacterium sp.]|jgi:2-iminobutanoate/2-iminopropanoate deaminase|uniref:Rid family detoxifying hydrolase n=1 Tax=Bifidobacterium sp. TaxID=41200 RepID=UPI0025B858E3|nr:Rid family detoxifying hydrolase [Bifidobacterium sp.]MCI1634697.1 Rid family detoxifying hydrolase [Bifidobacterium sp.]